MEATDKEDKYLIWKIMDKRFGGEMGVCDMVIKSCLEMVMVMNYMDQDGPKHPLQEVEVFFDGAHKRVSGYISLGLWATIISMRRLLRLASCEVKWERTSDIRQFWKAINEMLTSLNGKPTKFNPKCIMVDENSANFNGIQEEFGLQFKLEKMVSCQRHFQANAILKSKLLPYSFREDWINTCFQLCSCTTVARYNELMEELNKFVRMFGQVGPFVAWWDARKYHVFPPFRRYGYTRANLAEVGNAMCKRRNQLYLLEAAKDDTASMLIQAEDYKAFLRQEVSSSGSAPNDLARAADQRMEQIRMAKAAAREFADPEARAALLQEYEEASTSAFKPANCRHRPGNAKDVQGTTIDPNTGKKKKTSKRRRSSNANVPPSVLENSLNMVREVMAEPDEDDEEQPPTSPPEEDEKPKIELYMSCVRKCQGCPDPIDKDLHKPPKDLVIRTKGLRIWFDKKMNQRRSAHGKLYFHLKMSCLVKKYGNKYTKEDLRVEDDTLRFLTREHMRYLKKEGFLSVLTAGRPDPAGNNNSN